MFTNVNHDAIQPEEIELLQRVFNQFCADANVETCSEQAEFVGASLIEMYQAGCRHEATLLAEARCRHSDLLQKMA